MNNINHHYPEHLLKDYKTLMEFFPSNLFCRPVVSQIIEEWKEKNNINKPYILEIGPGFGETTELILESVPCTMVLVEVDEQASSVLSQKFNRSGNKVDIITADALEWIKDQPTESFDVFTASWTIHNFLETERKVFIPEVYRVLKKGGLFVIFDKILPDNSSEVAKYWEVHIERMKGLDSIGRSKLKNEMIAHEERDAKPPYVWKEKDAIRDLEELGFNNITFCSRNERDVILVAEK